MSTPPSNLGPYPVERELGRGGMGVVYLGRDPRLNRPVAIKVLPDAMALNQESLARFDREAKLLASLNHPNIATIYGIEESGGQRLLVLEYIPGDTLAGHIARGPLSIDEALDICRQVALAIEAAHEGGVIHRDLKPGNIKITPDGQVKVLDFGLAKGSAPVSDAELAHSPTMTFAAATGMGVILGTAGYMSPEQARGKAVDRRTDIWSFGCVLFECLARRQIFEGETVSDTIAKILEREPDWKALPANTPHAVREILRRCLEKDLKKRQRDIGDVRIQLEEAVAARASSTRLTTDTTSPAPRFALPMKTTAIATLLILFGAIAGIGLWNTIGSGARDTAPAAAGPVRASIAVARSIRAVGIGGITPDGRTVIIGGYLRNPDGTEDRVTRLYTRRMDDYEFKPLPGTEQATTARISADGRWLAVVTPVSDQSTQRQLVKVPIDGSSPPVKIANMDAGWAWNGIAWLESGDFLISSQNGTTFVRLPRGGGAPGPETPFNLGNSAGLASFGSPLPNDRGVFLSVSTYNARGWQSDAWVFDPATNKAHRLIENAGSITYSPTGHVVFSRGETLMAAPFDLGSLTVTGEVTALSRDLRITSAWAHGNFSLSQNGTLMFAPGGLLGTDRRLVSIDAAGAITPFGTERRGYEIDPVVSRDGRQVAVVLTNEKGTNEIWAATRDRPILRRLIAIPNVDCLESQWSPNGQLLAFARFAQDKDDGVYVQNADGTGAPRLVFRSEVVGVYVWPSSWTRDGSGLIVSKLHNGKNSLWFVPVTANGAPAAPRAVRTTPYSDKNGRLSPDDRFMAYYSDESGRGEIYVATYDAGGVLGAPLRASNGSDGSVAWASDGRLFFSNLEGRLMSVTVDARPALAVSAPVAGLDLKKLRVAGWSMLPDGRVFANERSEAENELTSFSVVFNWFDELRARMANSKAELRR
jgi:hypothetical protein